MIELSIAVHRFAMYPEGHPSLTPAIDRVYSRLRTVFPNQGHLSIGVARDRLIIDGVATDPDHPVLGDLARRLHDHQLSAIWFSDGVPPVEVEELLRLLSADPERGDGPIGLHPEQMPSWGSVGLSPIRYSDLVMEGEGVEREDRAGSLWVKLAQAVVGGAEGPESPNDSTDGSDLARMLRERSSDEAYDEVVASYLRQLAGELREGKGASNEWVKGEVAQLIEGLDEQGLGRLMTLGGGEAGPHQFLLDANQSLSVTPVIRMLEVAASSSQQSVSSSMTRLLSKLALHAERGPPTLRGAADMALRENVETLVEGWSLSDPNPEEYTAMLDAMARSTELLKISNGSEEVVSQPRRLFEMALEIDVPGAAVERAIPAILEEGSGPILLERLAEATPGKVTKQAWDLLGTTNCLSALLQTEGLDKAVLERLIEGLGTRAIEPLFEVLTESDSRAVRRLVFDALARMGPEVRERARDQLEDDRWFVKRNMLALLNELGAPTSDFDPVAFTWHPDYRVRRQAFALAMKDDRHRDWALAESVSSEDDRLVRMALDEMSEEVPEALVPVIVSRVVHADRDPDLQALGARALRSSRSLLARDSLIELATGGRSILGRTKVRASSPEVVESLRVLAERWREDPDAARILEQAARSRDEEVRTAVLPSGGAAS